MDIQRALKLLNKELIKADCRFTLYACGGAALRLLGVITRDTVDIDVITDQLDPVLIEAKNRVARKLRISEDWLNNKVTPLAERLSSDWMCHCIQVFTASHLSVYSISRQDLINAKLHAAVDRYAQDYNDLIDIRPTEQELETAREYTLKQGDTETYGVFVNGIVKSLRKDLGFK